MSSRRRGPAAGTSRIAVPSEGVEAPRGGLRAPCPCGSGKRYKQCHGRVRAGAAFVARPFQGLADETDWVAFREIVPAGTLRARTVEGTEVVFATVLPVAWPALRRVDGSVFVGIQAADASYDASRDLAAAMDAALAAPAPGPITHVDARASTARLQDRLDPDVASPIQVHAKTASDASAEPSRGSPWSTSDQIANTPVAVTNHPRKFVAGIPS